MSENELRALRNAAASSAMEGIPLSREHIEAVERMLNGEQTLQDYLLKLKDRFSED